jgi:hypothetical protein
MFTKLQLVMLGVVVLQGAGLNGMDKAGKSPRSPLSCSQEARKVESGDFTAVIVAMKRPREVSKEEKNNTSNLYYPWPGGNPEAHWHPTASIADRMKPWYPHPY